jgi:hypothetical protein
LYSSKSHLNPFLPGTTLLWLTTECPKLEEENSNSRDQITDWTRTRKSKRQSLIFSSPPLTFFFFFFQKDRQAPPLDEFSLWAIWARIIIVTHSMAHCCPIYRNTNSTYLPSILDMISLSRQLSDIYTVTSHLRTPLLPLGVGVRSHQRQKYCSQTALTGAINFICLALYIMILAHSQSHSRFSNHMSLQRH